MKKTIYLTLSVLLLIALIGCGENKKKSASGGKKSHHKHNHAICDRVERNGHYWKDPETGTRYRRDGNYLEEKGDKDVRINCSDRFSGEKGQCDNAYYANGYFYDYDTGERVSDCRIKDYYFIPNGNACPYGYSSYTDVYYMDGRAHYENFCLNTYMFYNQWGYSNNYYWSSSNDNSAPFWLATGFLAGLALGL